MKKLPALALLTMLLSACQTQTYIVSNQAAQTDPRFDDMQTFFVSGIAQTQRLNSTEICSGANKTAKIQTEQSVLNSLLGILTWGIYTPRDARIYCK